MSPQSPNKAVRMEQAQEAVGRIKVKERAHFIDGKSLCERLRGWGGGGSMEMLLLALNCKLRRNRVQFALT